MAVSGDGVIQLKYTWNAWQCLRVRGRPSCALYEEAGMKIKNAGLTWIIKGNPSTIWVPVTLSLFPLHRRAVDQNWMSLHEVMQVAGWTARSTPRAESKSSVGILVRPEALWGAGSPRGCWVPRLTQSLAPAEFSLNVSWQIEKSFGDGRSSYNRTRELLHSVWFLHTWGSICFSLWNNSYCLPGRKEKWAKWLQFCLLDFSTCCPLGAGICF